MHSGSPSGKSSTPLLVQVALQLRPSGGASPEGDYRVRASARSLDRAQVERVSNEVLALYCAGPAGGAGVRQNVTAQVHTASILVDRDQVKPRVSLAR